MSAMSRRSLIICLDDVMIPAVLEHINLQLLSFIKVCTTDVMLQSNKAECFYKLMVRTCTVLLSLFACCLSSRISCSSSSFSAFKCFCVFRYVSMSWFSLSTSSFKLFSWVLDDLAVSFAA